MPSSGSTHTAQCWGAASTSCWGRWGKTQSCSLLNLYYYVCVCVCRTEDVEGRRSRGSSSASAVSLQPSLRTWPTSESTLRTTPAADSWYNTHLTHCRPGGISPPSSLPPSLPPSLPQGRLDMKAKAIRDEACSKLQLPQFKYQLCEVKSSGEKVVFKENDISIASKLSINGRLFILPRTHSQRTVVR